MDKVKLINKIFKKLEKNHINLYHSISEQNFNKEKQKLIKKANLLTETEFDYEISKLFSLFKDAHTTYQGEDEKRIKLNAKIDMLDGEVYLIEGSNNKKLAHKILAVNNFEINKIIKKIKKIISYETNEWLNYAITKELFHLKVYSLIGISTIKDEIINFKTTGGNFKIKIDKACQNKTKKLPYHFKIIEDILYVRYSQCIEDKNYLFKDFVEDIIKQTKNKIQKFILDVRNNTGGNSEILNLLQDYLISQNMQGTVLINEGTFSSGRFAVARFKKYLNVAIIGSPTGGAAKSYGYIKDLKVGKKNFTASIRLWDFSHIFAVEGAIQPDIFVKKTYDDLIGKTDSTLSAAINYFKNLN